MKKIHLNKLVTTLMVSVFAFSCLSLVSCNDDSEEIFDYPEGAEIITGDSAKPFKATRLKGTLSFDEEEQKWIIEPELHNNIGCFTGFIFPICIVSNMSEEYESMSGDIVYSGIVKALYRISNRCYYSIKLTELTPNEKE